MRLFVGNLPWSVTDQQLSDMFAAHGTVVSARVITHRDTGKSRGFGFVEMSSDEEGQKAIDALNGNQIDGRAMVVSVARPAEERPSGGGGGRSYSDRGGFNRGGNRDRHDRRNG